MFITLKIFKLEFNFNDQQLHIVNMLYFKSQILFNH